MPVQKRFSFLDEIPETSTTVDPTEVDRPTETTLTVIRFGPEESLVETDAGFFFVPTSEIQNSVNPQVVRSDIPMRPAPDLGPLVDRVTFGYRDALRALHRVGITESSSVEDVVQALRNFGKFSIKRGT